MNNEEEEAQFLDEVARVERFLSSPRFAHHTRNHTAQDIARVRSTIPIEYSLSTQLSDKLYGLLRKRFDEKKFSHTFGALDPVQVVQMAKYLEAVYVSGWQSSATAASSNEPGPDFADYRTHYTCNLLLNYASRSVRYRAQEGRSVGEGASVS